MDEVLRVVREIIGTLPRYRRGPSFVDIDFSSLTSNTIRARALWDPRTSVITQATPPDDNGLTLLWVAIVTCVRKEDARYV